MKKRLLIIFSLICLIILPKQVFAFSASASCSPGSKTVAVGETFTVTISTASTETDWMAIGPVNADTSKLSLQSDGGAGIDRDDTTGFSQSYTFRAVAEGTAYINQSFNVTNTDDYSTRTVKSSSCTINVVRASSSNSSSNRSSNNSNRSNNNANKSGNNNLKLLSINDVTISPDFDKDKLEYSAVVEGTQEKININAEAEDGKASISGAGEKDLEEGLNEIIISVIAENGDVKEYKISVTRKEKNPIEVLIGKKKYTVLKKETELEVPEGFTKTTIVMNEQDVVAYSNEYTAYMLVVLVDEEGNANFYVFDQKNDIYTEYVEFESKNIKLMLMEPKSKDVPYNYKKVTFPVDGKTVKGYYLEYKSEFRLVYGMNMSNGDVGFYLYDMNEKTFQRFYNVQVETYIDLVKKFKYVSLGIGTLTFILFIIVIALLSKNRSLKKKLKGNVKKEEKKEEIKTLTREERLRLKEENSKTKKLLEVKEEPKEEKVDKKALKAEKKRLAKEEKLKAKEAKKLEKEKKKAEKVSKEPVDKNSIKEQKRIQREEDKKLKEEANDFLK